MGYDVSRFQGAVDADLLCPLCGGVLEEPVQAPRCEHAFCGACIARWLSQRRPHTCPVDRGAVAAAQLGPVPRVLRNMLAKLRIACDNAAFGCGAVVRLDGLASHLGGCEHSPGRRQGERGERGDGPEGPPEELPAGHGLPHLRALVRQQQARLAALERASADHALQLAEQERAIQQLKDCLAPACNTRPDPQGAPPGEPPGEHSGEEEEEEEEEEVLRWVSSLQPARVTRWGGMISTPDAGLQAALERSLLDSGCPAPVVGELIRNAHERGWPPGLATLETRQTNRRRYKNYVAKRIPGRQAVVVMACENRHMGEGMVREPGLVMVFSHGVEEV